MNRTSLLISLVITLGLMLAPLPTRAEPLAQSRYHTDEDHAPDHQAAFLHFATHYAETMLLGLLTGGLLMNQLVGGLPATLAGTVGGALVAGWLYLDQVSDSYIVQEIH